jgi:hypothetical protein
MARARRWVRDEAPFLFVIAVLVGAVVYLAIWSDHWRRAVGLVALSLFLAAVLRACVPRRRVGMLGVRGRWRDTVCYLLIASAILAAAIRLH